MYKLTCDLATPPCTTNHRMHRPGHTLMWCWLSHARVFENQHQHHSVSSSSIKSILCSNQPTLDYSQP
jgi:hypothetical protein